MIQIYWRKAVIFMLLILWLIILFLVLGILKRETRHPPKKRIFSGLKDIIRSHREDFDEHQAENVLQQETHFGSLSGDLKNMFSWQKEMKEENTDNSFKPNGIFPRDKMPSIPYEMTRRRLFKGIEEMWFFISNQMMKMEQNSSLIPSRLSSKFKKILDEGLEHKRSLLNDAAKLADFDGFAFWRRQEAADLSDLVQRRLKYLQNPKDCDSTKKLVCDLNKNCGYGCQIHHAVYCLIVAYSTERTLILHSNGWRYNSRGWESTFLPLSENCTNVNRVVHQWPGQPQSPAVFLGEVDFVSPKPQCLPLSVPKDLAIRIARLNGDPPAWWVGQFLKYLLRPQPSTVELLKDAGSKLQYRRPIVGVQIRRTDKIGLEADFHPVEEYMRHAEEYFSQNTFPHSALKKRIYLASDDYRVFQEIKKKYPEYEVVGDPQISITARGRNRYSENSLKGIVTDIHFLAHSDFLICTFSSQFCRLAYEIMQTLHPDASTKFRSLDDIYYFGGQTSHRAIATMKHNASSPNEIDLEIGDIIEVAGNHWDGYSKGNNVHNNRVGIYPTFKVEDIVQLFDCPKYQNVP